MAKNRKEQRKENYRLLIAAGFSSQEAQRLRDLSNQRVQEIIADRTKIPEKSERHVRAARKGLAKKKPVHACMTFSETKYRKEESHIPGSNPG